MPARPRIKADISVVSAGRVRTARVPAEESVATAGAKSARLTPKKELLMPSEFNPRQGFRRKSCCCRRVGNTGGTPERKMLSPVVFTSGAASKKRVCQSRPLDLPATTPKKELELAVLLILLDSKKALSLPVTLASPAERPKKESSRLSCCCRLQTFRRKNWSWLCCLILLDSQKSVVAARDIGISGRTPEKRISRTCRIAAACVHSEERIVACCIRQARAASEKELLLPVWFEKPA